MVNEFKNVTVSTDVLGVFADPGRVQRLYEGAGFRCDLEVIAMPVQYSYLIRQSRGYSVGYDLGGVHGQVLAHPGVLNKKFGGVTDYLKVNVANMLLQPIVNSNDRLLGISAGKRVDMIASQMKKDIYFNVHNGVVANCWSDFISFGRFARFSHLTIENGNTFDDVTKTIDLVHKLQDNGIEKTTGTFDLVHAIVAMGDNIDLYTVKKFWGKMLNQIGGDFKHLHLPIGINYDSLPIMDMLSEKAMLKDLGRKIKERGLKITLENQHDLLFGACYKKEQERLKKIRVGLIECGLEL